MSVIPSDGASSGPFTPRFTRTSIAEQLLPLVRRSRDDLQTVVAELEASGMAGDNGSVGNRLRILGMHLATIDNILNLKAGGTDQQSERFGTDWAL